MADLHEDVAAKQDPKKIKVSWKKRIFSKYLFIITLGLLLGSFHKNYVSKLFEADRNFSLLSPLEREMSFRTEMGFYYSYYKTIVEEKPLALGLSKIMNDRIVEFPKEVNAINRFNIHPELVIGVLFNYLEPYLNGTVECYVLDRGELPEVDTCVGLGEPIYFYLEVIWWLSGLTVAMLFYISVSLCGTYTGGLLSVLFYMCHHMDATRVMWTPNERENFAQPFLLIQMFLITVQLKQSKEIMSGLWLQFVVVIVNCICLLCWQFTQFIFLTQLVILFFMEQFHIISSRALCVFLHGHFCGIHLAILLLQGNDMLKTSLYVCVFVLLSIYGLVFSYFRVELDRRLYVILECIAIVMRGSLLMRSSIWLKKLANHMFETDEDSHVFDIFYSKFGLVTSFHTKMYTCASVFDFMPYATWAKLTNSGLLPLIAIVIVNVLGYCNYNGRRAVEEYDAKKVVEEPGNGDDNQSETDPITKPDEKCAEKEKDPSVENIINAKNEETPEDADSEEKTNDNVKDAKDAEPLKDVKSAEKSNDDKCVDDNEDAKATETIKVAKSTQTANDAKTLEEAKETKVAKKAEKANTEQNNKNEDKVIVYLKNLHLDSALFYHLAQMAAFGFMSALVMRLKLLFVPHLCIVAACSCSYMYYTRFSRKRQLVTGLVIIIYVGMALYNARINIEQEMSYVGQYSDPYLEELLKWIAEETSAAAVFAGPMPVTAVVMLTTRRAIVNHPHYEHADARHRNYVVYKMYGRFQPQQYYDELNKLKVTHLIVDKTYCYGESTTGCSFSNIWDLEYPLKKSEPILCHKLIADELQNFYPVFDNPMYTVVRVHDYSIKYDPKLLNT